MKNIFRKRMCDKFLMLHSWPYTLIVKPNKEVPLQRQ